MDVTLLSKWREGEVVRGASRWQGTVSAEQFVQCGARCQLNGQLSEKILHKQHSTAALDVPSVRGWRIECDGRVAFCNGLQVYRRVNKYLRHILDTNDDL